MSNARRLCPRREFNFGIGGGAGFGRLVFWAGCAIICFVPPASRSSAWLRRVVWLAQFILVNALLLVGFAASGTSSGSRSYLIDVWTSDNGLPNSSVTAIAQTPEGYLWAGTLNGLARFDGVRFVNFDPLNTPELQHSRVTGLFLDARGTLWINTYDGSLTSWRNGRFRHEWQGASGLQMAQMFSRSNDLVFVTLGGDLLFRTGSFDSNGEWNMMKPPQLTVGSSYREDHEGALWFFTRDGSNLGRVTGTNFEILPEGLGLGNQKVSSIAADHSKQIWIGTDKGIAVWDGEQFQNQTPTNGEAQLNVSLMYCAGDGGVWVLGNDRVRKCAGRQWVVEAEAWGELFGAHMPALSVHEDRQGSVWFRHLGQGVFRATTNGALQRISSTDGLPGDRVTGWLEDRDGGIWVGVDRGGLVHLRERKFQVMDAAGGPGAAASVCEDNQGAVLVGTLGNGLNRWQGNQLTTFSSAEEAASKFIFSVCPDTQGRLWLSAGREDLFMCEQERITRPSWDVHGVKAIFTDHQGGVWLGKSRGLARISDGVLTDFSSDDGFERTDVHAIAEDRGGDIWVGGGKGSLYRFHEGKFTLLKPADALADATIWSLLTDDGGVLWVGTFRGGLLRYKNGSFTRFNTEDGLPSDVICQILDDGKGNLWLGSQKGVFSVSKAALEEFVRGKSPALACGVYGISDGLPTLECSGGYQPSAWRGRDGRLWFTTFRGVVSIQPQAIPKNQLPPPVLLEGVNVDGKPVVAGWNSKGEKSVVTNPASLAVPVAADLQIQPGRHYFEFRYTGLSFVAPDQVRFRYRLDGLESAWVEAGNRREAHYSHLAPGEYKFLVSACNNDGVWNEQGAAFAFSVLPHFYETSWFQALMVVLLVGVVTGTVRSLVVRRMRREMELLERQRAVERDRARIAQDIHDDLGAGLTRIMLQSELARRDPPQEVQAHLGRIADMARGMTRAMDEIVWAVDPKHDTLSGLMDYTTAFAEEFLQVAGIRCRMDLPTEILPLHVDAELRYNLFLALKEALNNVVKHAHATEVWLRLRVEPDSFTLVVEDNGCGLQETSGHVGEHRIVSGHGLSNLEKRLQMVGGRCVVYTAPGKGVHVEMTIRAQTKGSAIMAMGNDRPKEV